MKRYERNRIYISDEDQVKIKGFRVLLAGIGIGSNIAEALLRIGFESITLIDGGVVEECNLNRQNYTEEDLGQPKVEALKRRLLSINPQAQITAIDTLINRDNVNDIVVKHDVVINALDYKNDIPFVIDQVCAEQRIYVLHPYNVGFAGIVVVISPNGPQLDSLLTNEKGHVEFEKRFLHYVIDYFNYSIRPKIWLQEFLIKYEKEEMSLPAPQLSIASTLIAGICTSILIRIVRGEFVKVFPKFYYYSEYDDLN